MSKLTMYMVTHKEVKDIPSGRTPIFVGNGKNSNNYLRDITGDNISKKNKNFCELTALYWIWKNDRDSEFVSIEHYRRFFMKKHSMAKIISKKDVESMLSNNRIILPESNKFSMKISEAYCYCHDKNDYYNTRDIILRTFPNYLHDFDEVMNGYSCNMLNMMIMPKKFFDEYCEWLFNVLFKLEKMNGDISSRSSYQQRAYGFMSERLLNVWIKHNSSIEIEELPVYQVESSKLKSVLRIIKHRINNRPFDQRNEKLH